MHAVAVYEAKTRLSELLTAVEQGEVVTITRRGLPVARLVAATPTNPSLTGQREVVAQAFALLNAARQGVRLDGDLKAIAADGRD